MRRVVCGAETAHPELEEESGEPLDLTVTRLLSKLRTIAAFSYKKSIGEPFVYPSHRYSYCENFLNMMFRSPVNEARRARPQTHWTPAVEMSPGAGSPVAGV